MSSGPTSAGLERRAAALRERVVEADRAGHVERRHHLLHLADDVVDDQRLRKAEHVAHRREHDLLGRHRRHHLLQHAGEVLDDDDRLGARVLQLVLELARRVERIDVDDDQPGAQDRRDRDRVLRHVGHHHRDAVALGEALRLQPGGERRRGPIDLLEGDRLAHELVRRAIGVAAKALVEQGDERAVLVHVDLGRNARRVLLQPDLFHRGARSRVDRAAILTWPDGRHARVFHACRWRRERRRSDSQRAGVGAHRALGLDRRGDIPAAAERLDQGDRGHLPVDRGLHQRAPRRERRRLRRDDVGVAELAGAVAVEDLLLGVVGGIRRLTLSSSACSACARALVSWSSTPWKAVEHGLSIARDGDVARGLGGGDARRRSRRHRTPSARPKRRATRARSTTLEQIADARARCCRATRVSVRLGKYAGALDADLRVGGGDLALGRGDVGPALQQRRRHADRQRRHAPRSTAAPARA